ncbi:hypothetical protein Y1Q_0016456 [Alligator mississippiensis]|uniref:Uncharacterized protein n=1 Tax=Alligator mississippiensis TaxID=8496 RepID=A0A151N2V4_ALLMI|nr:hypothetical protein Y1Q_0016456 [Alligator mississippiensis]
MHKKTGTFKPTRSRKWMLLAWDLRVEDGVESKVRSIHFLLLVGLKVPVFLCMVCAVVWVSVRYRASSSDTVPHRRDHDLPRS